MKQQSSTTVSDLQERKERLRLREEASVSGRDEATTAGSLLLGLGRANHANGDLTERRTSGERRLDDGDEGLRARA
jgi:hypothetical protein